MDGVRAGSEGYRQQFQGLAAVEKDLWGGGGGGTSSGGSGGVGEKEGMKGWVGEVGQGQGAFSMPEDGDDDERKTVTTGLIMPPRIILSPVSPHGLLVYQPQRPIDLFITRPHPTLSVLQPILP